MPEWLRVQGDRLYDCNDNWLGFHSNASRYTEKDKRLGILDPGKLGHCRQLPQGGDEKQDATNARCEFCGWRSPFSREEQQAHPSQMLIATLRLPAAGIAADWFRYAETPGRVRRGSVHLSRIAGLRTRRRLLGYRGPPEVGRQVAVPSVISTVLQLTFDIRPDVCPESTSGGIRMIRLQALAMICRCYLGTRTCSGVAAILSRRDCTKSICSSTERWSNPGGGAGHSLT
jgi:hypothetical protein